MMTRTAAVLLLGQTCAFQASVQPLSHSARRSSPLAATATTEEPVLTLYRDTNGWCPFCARVWLALEQKGVAYEEKLVNLRDKPTWFTDIVPTGLVPAVELHVDANSKLERIFLPVPSC